MLEILLRHPIKIVVYSVHPWDPLKQKYQVEENRLYPKTEMEEALQKCTGVWGSWKLWKSMRSMNQN